MNIRGWRNWPAVFALAAIATVSVGCARKHYPYRGANFEERYRVFFTYELPDDLRVGASSDEVAKYFSPEQSVRGSMDALAAEGFELTKIRKLDWGDGATLFVFRRSLDEPEIDDRSPLHFTGVFRREDKGKEPVYYSFAQLADGYLVHMIGPEGAKTIRAKWESRELQWNDDAGWHHLQLTPDAMTLLHITESAQGFDVPRERSVVRIPRLVETQTADERSVREARRHLVKLRPATRRSYDPFPW